MKANRSLQQFHCSQVMNVEEERKNLADILQHWNTTLEEVDSGWPLYGGTDCMHNKRIQYYAKLNKYMKARNRSTSLGAFVALLCDVRSSTETSDETEKDSLQYSLLRECPSLWSSAILLDLSLNRKRKLLVLTDGRTTPVAKKQAL